MVKAAVAVVAGPRSMVNWSATWLMTHRPWPCAVCQTASSPGRGAGGGGPSSLTSHSSTPSRTHKRSRPWPAPCRTALAASSWATVTTS
jgi:hypothetical protein